MKDEHLLSPIEYYKTTLRDKLTDELSSSFDALVKETNTDEKENEKLVKEYKNQEELSKSAKKHSSFRSFLFAIITVFFIGVIAYFVKSEEPFVIFNTDVDKTKLILPLSIVYLIISLFFIKWISSFDKKADNHKDKAEEAKEKAIKTLENISNVFNEEIYKKVVSDILPSIEFYHTLPNNFDEYLDAISEKTKSDLNSITNVKEMYYERVNDRDVASVSHFSGSVEGKPFIFRRDLVFYMGSRTYYGSISLPYEEDYQDSEGKWHTRTEYETLRASVTMPYPEYSFRSLLYYFTPNALNLDFDRHPYDDKSMGLSSYVEKNNKKLKKLEKKVITEGNGSLFLTDREFEAIFNVMERNNDVEFRMMYTPYVIKNTKELILSKDGFGNNFSLYKRGGMNILTTDEIVYFENGLYPKGSDIFDYSLQESKARFIKGGVLFFRSIYFSLAPLFVVRLNSDGESIKSIENKESISSIDENNRNGCDAESLLYENINSVRPKGSDFSVGIIAKAEFKEKIDEVSVFKVDSFSFSIGHKFTEIYTIGWHTRGYVPVHYDEYERESETFYLLSSYIGLPSKIVKDFISDYPSDNLLYKNGFLGYVLSVLDKEGINRYKMLKEEVQRKACEKE